jgi:hypothetical protein
VRDYKGILIAKGRKMQGDNLAPEVNRIWDALDPIDAFLRDMSSGMGRISKGQNPDSSGDPLGGPHLDDYFFLPGRIGNQTGHGGTLASGTLTLSSTQHSTKGNIFLGEAEESAYDELNDRLGLGTTSPNARLEVEVPIVFAYSRPSADVTDGTWAKFENGAVGNNTDLYSMINEVTLDESKYITQGAGNGASQCQINCDLTPVASATAMTWRVSARTVGSGGTWAFNRTLRRGATTIVCFTGPVAGGGCGSGTDNGTGVTLTSSFQTLTWPLSQAAITAWFAASGTPSVLFGGSGVGGTTAFEVAWTEVEFTTGEGEVDIQRWTLDGTVKSLVDETGRFGISTGSTSAITHTLTIGDLSDPTKRVGFDLSGITTGTTKEWDAPNASGSVVLATAQPAVGSLIYGNGATNPMAILAIGASGDVLRVDAGLPDWQTPSSLATRVIRRWTANGPYKVDTSVDGGWISPTAMTISAVWLHRTTAGTSSSTILDLNKNGTTMYTTQGNRPTIAFNDADNKVLATLPDVVAVAAGDILTIDIDQIEGGVARHVSLIVEGA